MVSSELDVTAPPGEHVGLALPPTLIAAFGSNNPDHSHTLEFTLNEISRSMLHGSRNSESISNRELDSPARRGRSHLAEKGRVRLDIGRVEVCVIEQIPDIGADCYSMVRGDQAGLGQRK